MGQRYKPVSPQVIETEMMHTYAASRWQALWMLRLPAALPFLFPALRVGIRPGWWVRWWPNCRLGRRPAWGRAC